MPVYIKKKIPCPNCRATRSRTIEKICTCRRKKNCPTCGGKGLYDTIVACERCEGKKEIWVQTWP